MFLSHWQWFFRENNYNLWQWSRLLFFLVFLFLPLLLWNRDSFFLFLCLSSGFTILHWRPGPWTVRLRKHGHLRRPEKWRMCPISETPSYNFHNFGYFRRFQEAMINKIEEMKKKISTKIIFNYKCTIFMTYFGFQIDASDWPRVSSNQN